MTIVFFLQVYELLVIEQELFYGSKTLNVSRALTTDHIINFAAKAVGKSYYSALHSGFLNTESNHATRISFKVRTPGLIFPFKVIK